MTTFLFAAALTSGSIQGVSNIHDTGPQAQHDAVAEVAAMTDSVLFAPDKTARGYSMRSIEISKLPQGYFSGLGSRYAVRMRFINQATSSAFDLYQVSSSAKVDAVKHMSWLLKSSTFEGNVDKHDTFVSMKRGTTDLAFVGGLVSEPSAKELLKRLVKIQPQLNAKKDQ
jgi:hypothetical protein